MDDLDDLMQHGGLGLTGGCEGELDNNLDNEISVREDRGNSFFVSNYAGLATLGRKSSVRHDTGGLPMFDSEDEGQLEVVGAAHNHAEVIAPFG